MSLFAWPPARRWQRTRKPPITGMATGVERPHITDGRSKDSRVDKGAARKWMSLRGEQRRGNPVRLTTTVTDCRSGLPRYARNDDRWTRT